MRLHEGFFFRSLVTLVTDVGNGGFAVTKLRGAIFSGSKRMNNREAVKVKKIEWSIMVIPPKIVAVCAACRYELTRVSYNGYKEREERLTTLQIELSSCPKCKAVFKIQ